MFSSYHSYPANSPETQSLHTLTLISGTPAIARLRKKQYFCTVKRKSPDFPATQTPTQIPNPHDHPQTQLPATCPHLTRRRPHPRPHPPPVGASSSLLSSLTLFIHIHCSTLKSFYLCSEKSSSPSAPSSLPQEAPREASDYACPLPTPAPPTALSFSFPQSAASAASRLRVLRSLRDGLYPTYPKPRPLPLRPSA